MVYNKNTTLYHRLRGQSCVLAKPISSPFVLLIGSWLVVLAIATNGQAGLYACRGAGGSIQYTNVPNSPSCRLHQLKKPYRSWARTLSFSGDGSYDGMIRKIATRHHVDPPLIKAIIHTESDFNPRAVSRRGALGLMQLMPATARELRVENPFNPSENIDGGTRYMRQMLDNFNNDLILSLAAYNAGPNLVARTGGVPDIVETRQYINKVLRRYRYYRSTW